MTQSCQTVYISSQSQCEAYGASIDYVPFSDGFVNDVQYLHEVLNLSTKTDYLAFIQKYKTHIVTACLIITELLTTLGFGMFALVKLTPSSNDEMSRIKNYYYYYNCY